MIEFEHDDEDVGVKPEVTTRFHFSALPVHQSLPRSSHRYSKEGIGRMYQARALVQSSLTTSTPPVLPARLQMLRGQSVAQA